MYDDDEEGDVCVGCLLVWMLIAICLVLIVTSNIIPATPEQILIETNRKECLNGADDRYNQCIYTDTPALNCRIRYDIEMDKCRKT